MKVYKQVIIPGIIKVTCSDIHYGSYYVGLCVSHCVGNYESPYAGHFENQFAFGCICQICG